MIDRLKVHLLLFQLIMLFLKFDKSIRNTLDLKNSEFQCTLRPYFVQKSRPRGRTARVSAKYFKIPFLAEGARPQIRQECAGGGPPQARSSFFGVLLRFCLNFRLYTGPRA
jgi:hypothetical protein